MKPTLISRRHFLACSVAAGGGMLLVSYPSTSANTASDSLKDNAGQFVPNIYIKINHDNRVTIAAKNPEIGQGVKTSLPMIIAEELDADWDQVDVVQSAISEEQFGPQFAGGSLSVVLNWDRLRHAGAAARHMLLAAAAGVWGVDVAKCRTEKGKVIHDKTGQQLTYGALADAAAKEQIPSIESLVLKKREDYRLLGKRIGGVDNHKIVTGQPLFGIDQSHAGMLYASYTRCPKPGGKVRSANLDEILTMPGVSDAFILEGNDNGLELNAGVAIVADSTWRAFKAHRNLKIEWDESAASKDSWSSQMEQAEANENRYGTKDISSFGDSAQAIKDAEVSREGFYSYPFLSHATLEPQNCTAHFKNDELTIWAPTQTPQSAIKVAVSVTDLDESKITVHQTRIGGGFGRRLMNDYVAEAAAIAMRTSAPVKLQWTREQDMAQDFYRVGGFHRMRGALDSKGRLLAWENHFTTFTSDGKKPVRGGDMDPGIFPTPLIAHHRDTETSLPLSTPAGYWRAPSSCGIAFPIQSFLHELAVAGDRDHLEFLLEILGEPRWLKEDDRKALNTGRAAAVIKLAAQKAGWGDKLPQGRGLGLAFFFSHAGHIAEVVDLSVSKDKKITVHKVTVVADVGQIVNLSGAENQCEGSVVDGLSTALALSVSIENGVTRESNFHQYPLLRMNNIPEIDVHFIQSEFAPTGLGEPALPPVAPALANAIFQATGERVRKLPLSLAGYSV